MSNHTLPGSVLLPLPAEIASLVTSLCVRSRIFRKHFDHAPKPGSPSTFAYLLPLLRTAMAYGYRDEERLHRLAQYWCERWRTRGHQFEEATCKRVLATAHADLGKKEILPLPEYLQKKRTREVNNIPHKDYLIGESTATNQANPAMTSNNLDSCSLPQPLRPEGVKWKLFGTQGKAIAGLGAHRLDFNQKYTDLPECGIWDWTEAYLRSIGYFALCAGCSEPEVLWLQQHFTASHSRAYIWTAHRFQELLADAQLFVEISGGRTQKKMRTLGKTGRKTRKDKGTGKKARIVAELLVAGWSRARIAKKLKVHRSTVTRHLAVIEQCGGIARLYPDLASSFEAPFSRELFNLCKHHKYPLGALRADALMTEVERFARQVQQEDFLNQNRLRRALRRRKNNSWKAIRQTILNLIAKQVVRERPSVLPLVERFQKIGLKLQFPDAERPVRVRLGFPKAVSLAFRILESLRDSGAPNQLLGNTDWIWQAIKDCSSLSEVLDKAVDQWIEKREQRLLSWLKAA